MNDKRRVDESQEEWLGAKWSTWGCVAVLGSLAIAGLAVAIVLYGIFTTPQAFGPEGVLSTDQALEMPFTPPPDEDTFVGIPPIGVAQFTTRHAIQIADGIVFGVVRTALDWDPAPPRAPQVEYVVVEIRLENNSDQPVPLAPGQFSMRTASEGPLQPIDAPEVPNLLTDQVVEPGETVEAIMVFQREDLTQLRRYMTYTPPFRERPIEVLLIP
jgi:hypothetical protein